MPLTTFAAIDVGSYEVSLKIFEISKKYGIKELDCIRHTMELGAQTYTNGKISYALVDELCKILINFNTKMKEYKVIDYIACATSAIREAENKNMILDQVKLRSGLKIKILSNSEQRFLFYKAVSLKEDTFHQSIKKGAAIIDVGSGSTQISLFEKEALVTTQNIKLGSLRIREILADIQNQTTNFNNLVEEFINRHIMTFHNLYLKDKKIRNIIAIGDVLVEYKLFHQSNNSNLITKDEFTNIYNNLNKKTIDELSFELGISREQSALIFPTAMIYNKIFEITNATIMWLPGVTLCDGIAADYAEKKEKIVPSHSFINDIVMSARNIASHYQCDILHTENVEYLALIIFDSIKKLHGLDKRERLLLQIAVILHNCGEYINMNEVSINSYHIILSSEIIGLSHYERKLVANICKYYSLDTLDLGDMSGFSDSESYIKLAKLTAILKIADALDKSHKQKLSKIKVMLRESELIITADTFKDITLEKGLFNEKANFFEEVYGIRPILKQKRSI